MTGQAPTTAPTTSDWWGSRHGMTQPASSASTSRYLFVDDGGRRRGVRDLVVLVAGAPGAIGSWIARHFAAEEATVALTYRADRNSSEHVAAERRARGGSAATNKARVQLALLASCGGKRWVVEDAGSVLDELDAAVEGSAFDHVECDVGVAVVDAF